MTIAVVCPFYFCSDHDRADITRHVFKHYANMPDITFIGVGSEADLSREMFCEHHAEGEYREFEQYWDGNLVGPNGCAGLRRKFNAAVQAARDYEPEAVFLVGSDDIVPSAFFTPSDEELVGLGQGVDGGCYFWPYGLNVSYWWYGASAQRHKTMFAGGCLGFSLDLLDRLDWAPFAFEGDEVGLEQHVRETTGSLEARYGMPAWHPKARRVLNDMTTLSANLTLLTSDPAFTARFLDYWNTLGAPAPVPDERRLSMPIDTSLLPALEDELRQAKQVSGGGQQPRPDRIAAIEEQIRIHLEALGGKVERKAKAEAKKLEAEAAAKIAEAEARAAAEVETADAKPAPEKAA